MKQVSINNLKAQINARIKQIGQSNIFISGTFVRKSNNGSIAHTVTSKVKGKTKSIYISVDLAEEVEQWTKEYKKVKRLMKDIDVLAEKIIEDYAQKKKRVESQKKNQE